MGFQSVRSDNPLRAQGGRRSSGTTCIWGSCSWHCSSTRACRLATTTSTRSATRTAAIRSTARCVCCVSRRFLLLLLGCRLLCLSCLRRSPAPQEELLLPTLCPLRAHRVLTTALVRLHKRAGFGRRAAAVQARQRARPALPRRRRSRRVSGRLVLGVMWALSSSAAAYYAHCHTSHALSVIVSVHLGTASCLRPATSRARRSCCSRRCAPSTRRGWRNSSSSSCCSSSSAGHGLHHGGHHHHGRHSRDHHGTLRLIVCFWVDADLLLLLLVQARCLPRRLSARCSSTLVRIETSPSSLDRYLSIGKSFSDII